jgi:mono/diheme cytochrome c family protein
VSSEELLRSLSWLFRIAAALFLAWLLLSRIASAEPTPPVGAVPTAADQTEAREVYESSCVTCHGPKGDGDGLGASGLPTKPANFTDPAWQKTVSDDEIARAIVGGGAVVRRSPLMPANPALASKPGVVAALRQMVRGFAKTKG